METLLEKAKKIRVSDLKKMPSDEIIDLSIAWLRGEITSHQAYKALNNNKKKANSYNIMYKMAIALKAAYIKNILFIKDNGLETKPEAQI